MQILNRIRNRMEMKRMRKNVYDHYVFFTKGNGTMFEEVKCLSCKHEEVASSMSPCRECVSFNQYEEK